MNAKDEALKNYILEALLYLGGQGSVIDVSRVIWENHESDLRGMGDVFYNWQYRIRWIAKTLSDEGFLTKDSVRRVWVLK